MVAEKNSKIVSLLARGQVTIPAEFRQRVGVNADTLLNVTLVGEKLEIELVRIGEAEGLREYTDRQIRLFLEEDRIDRATAAKVRELLTKGKL